MTELNKFLVFGRKASPNHRKLSEKELMTLPKRSIKARQVIITTPIGLNCWVNASVSIENKKTHKAILYLHNQFKN